MVRLGIKQTKDIEVFFAVTAIGPTLAAAGYFGGLGWLFWIGAAFCAFNLFMNVASGAMKFPLIPGIFMFAFAMNWTPWFLGVAAGLALYTALEAVSEIPALLKA